MERKSITYLLAAISLSIFVTSCCSQNNSTSDNQPIQPFPFEIPKEKPSFKLSKAMNRSYDSYKAATPQENELYSEFKYTELTGLDYNGLDGTK
ncbi:MAG: hypothetical protein R3Y50_07775 [Rikenellaceae bacterium]